MQKINKIVHFLNLNILHRNNHVVINKKRRKKLLMIIMTFVILPEKD